ncbi:MAG TPA: DUF5723 family protein [Bacteroidales bacterium]|nr:DUF5723 family protein [Bacteroidales bacterium]HPS16158.1 DUF5723 family protein [Bacteroidales bacterium]
MNNKLIILFFIFIISFPLFSQERFGISNSLYSGISNNKFNPALLAGSPYKWDFNLVSAHVYLDNNYVYIFQTNIPDIIADNGETEVIIDNDWNADKGNFSKYMFENKIHNNWRKNIYSSVIVEGPSFMFNVKKWTFAAEEALRVGVSANRIHEIPASFIFEGISYEELQDREITIPKFRANAMVWSEIGISVSRRIMEKKGRQLKAGITLKHLIGYGGAYALNKNINVNIPNDTSIIFNSVNAEYGYAINMDDFYDPDNSEKPFDVGGIIRNPKGHGKSFDIGITYEKKALENKYQCPNFCNKKLEIQYSWKIGFSFLDIGYIRFNKSAKTFNFENTSGDWYNESTKCEDFNGIDSLLSDYFNDSPNPKVQSTEFTMFLPWAACLSYDYNIGYNFYINGSWIQRIPHFGLPGIDRANSIAITPRFDHKNIGVAMPIVFHEYLWPRIGIALRIDNFLLIGTDKLGAIIGNRLSGADIYVALKFNELKKCKKKKTMPSFLPSNISVK